MQVRPKEDVQQPRFSAPPVRTVSFELLFRTDTSLTLSAVAGLLERWSAEFPHVRELAPQPRAGDAMSLGIIGDGDPWPFPLIELAGDDGRSVRLQSDSMAVNWQFNSESAMPYPGYSQLRASLDSLLGDFLQHLKQKGTTAVLTGAMCRYVNDISRYEPKALISGILSGWTDEDPSVVIDPAAAAYVGFRMHFEASQQLNECSVSVGVDPKSPESRPGTQSILEISVRKDGGGEEVSLADLDIVHERLTLTFLSSSNARLRDDWKQEN